MNERWFSQKAAANDMEYATTRGIVARFACCGMGNLPTRFYCRATPSRSFTSGLLSRIALSFIRSVILLNLNSLTALLWCPPDTRSLSLPPGSRGFCNRIVIRSSSKTPRNLLRGERRSDGMNERWFSQKAAENDMEYATTRGIAACFVG